MNRYSWWKYTLLAVALVVGLLYTLPNLYGEAPAVRAGRRDWRRDLISAGDCGCRRARTAARSAPRGGRDGAVPESVRLSRAALTCATWCLGGRAALGCAAPLRPATG